MDLNQHLVESMGVKLTDLSPSAAKVLQALAQIGSILQVDSEAGSTEAWLVSALDRWAKSEQELAVEQGLLASTQREVADIFLVKKALEQELSIASDTKLASEYTALTAEVKSLEEKLESLKPGWELEEELQHGKLVQLAKELEDAQAELGELEEKTSLCKDLPPHTELAKAKLEEAQQELFLLEEEWTHKVTNMWSN